MTVLVVDDQQSVRAVAACELAAAGHRVIEAADGREALELFRRHRPDLVLLDVEMPSHDGHAVARQMRLAEPDGWTPIVFLSSRSSDRDLWEGVAAGGDDYLVKPMRPLVLRAKLLAMQRLQGMRHRLLAMSDELSLANQRLSALSRIDALTGLFNRRAFDDTLAREVDAARRERSTLTLILCDLDHFKRFNDKAGHPEGDACLMRVGALLRSCCRRPRDVAARYGGEEFALVLPGTPKSGAAMFAEAVLRALAAAAIPHPDSPVAPHVTFSGGIATLEPSSPGDARELVARADEALYAAKRSGRNRFASWHLLDRLQPSAALSAVHGGG